MTATLALIFLNTALIGGSALNNEFRQDVYKVTSLATGQVSTAPVGFKAWIVDNGNVAIKRKGG